MNNSKGVVGLKFVEVWTNQQNSQQKRRTKNENIDGKL